MNKLPGELIGFGKRGPIYGIGGGSEPSPEPTARQDGLPVGGLHPAWDELMGVLPQEIHEQVTPVLKKWSQGVDQGFQKVHSQYAPYKSFVEQGIDPEVVNYGMNLYNMVENNPQQLFNALAEALGVDVNSLGEGANEPGEPAEPGDDNYQEYLEAQIADLMGRDETIAEFLMQQQQDAQIREEEEILEAELSDLHTKYKQDKGYDFDDLWVLSRYEGGDEDLQTAVDEFYTVMDERIGASNRPKPPVLLGSGGSLPSGGKKASQMSSEELNKNVVGLLEAYGQNR